MDKKPVSSVTDAHLVVLDEPTLAAFPARVLFTNKLITSCLLRLRMHEKYTKWLSLLLNIVSNVPILCLSVILTSYTVIAIPLGFSDHGWFQVIVTILSDIITAVQTYAIDKRLYSSIERNLLAKQLYLRFIRKCELVVAFYADSAILDEKRLQEISDEYQTLTDSAIELPKWIVDKCCIDRKGLLLLKNIETFDRVIAGKTATRPETKN